MPLPTSRWTPQGMISTSFARTGARGNWLKRNLEILSEASRRLPKELKDLEAHIPWRAVAGIGNILRHDYHETYPTVLWDTCNKDLKPLKDAVERIGRSIDADRNQHRKSGE